MFVCTCFTSRGFDFRTRRRFDVWELTAPDALSVGCGSPDYGEVDYGITGKGY